MNLNDSEVMELVKQVARLCEKAYRRGFQQGHCCGLGVEGFGTASSLAVYRWRVREDLDRAVPPPGSLHQLSMPAVKRLEIEALPDDLLLSSLIEQALGGIRRGLAGPSEGGTGRGK